MKLRGIILICFLLAMLLFTACGQNEATTAGDEPAAVEEAAAVAVVVEATETSQPIIEAAAEKTTEPEEEPQTEEPTPEPAPVLTSENCLNCHGDKEQLIDTAAPEPEETESSESSGVG